MATAIGDPEFRPGMVSVVQTHGDMLGWHPHVQILEVITALAMKTLSNHTNHVAETPLDVAFRETAWTPPEGG